MATPDRSIACLIFVDPEASIDNYRLYRMRSSAIYLFSRAVDTSDWSVCIFGAKDTDSTVSRLPSSLCSKRFCDVYQ